MCGAGAAGEKRSGGRRRGGGRAAGPPRPCTSRKMIPAHASEPRGVSKGRAAAKAAPVAARAAASVPPLGRRSTRRRASVGGTGTGTGDAPCATMKKRPTRGRGACKKQGGEGQEWCNAREERARARGARTQEWGHDAGRVGAGGCSRRGGRQRQRGEDNDGGSPQRGDPTAVPPRGVEPRTLPTIRPTGRPGQRLFSSVESQTTCSDVVGQVDFQLESAACSRCSTPGSARWGSMLSMVPAKPMVSKKPTPPVQKIETWATFEPPSPPEENLVFKLCRHEYRSSTGVS